MLRALSTACAAVLLVAACGGTSGSSDDPSTPEEETGLVEEGADANAVEVDAQLLVTSLASSIEARTFGDGVRTIFLPRTCIDVANDPGTGTAVYTFSGCLGPNGLRGVRGSLEARYELGAATLGLEVKAKGLVVNGATLDLEAKASIAVAGSDRTMTWEASLGGTTAGGRELQRRSTFEVTWTLGEACYGLDGTSEGQVGKREIRATVDGYRRCKRGCPEAGGSISLTNVARSRTVAIRYDGTNKASYTNARGKESTVTLLCVP